MADENTQSVATDIAEGWPARFWTRLEDGRLRCDICPRACQLHEGQRGLCFVRAAGLKGMVLTTYGRSSGFCVDPIEKKPLNHFLPGTPILSFGTAGCNLTCKFCQNWDISKARDFDKLSAKATPERIALAARQTGARSVAFTYNDPVIFHEYAIDAAKACHALGIQAVAVTAGYVNPAPRAEFYAHMDAANVDLKAFTEDFYHRLCTAHLDPVLDTLRWLARESQTWVEVTTLLIPGQNDGDEEIQRLAAWMAREMGPHVPLHFSAFHPDWKMPDTPATPPATLARARKLAMAEGLDFVYTGNVHDPEGGSTWCPSCKKLLIERDWYQLGAWNLNPDASCRFCGHIIAGRFEAAPGSWGPKRLPVRL
jgi:pyruvate formate lyase activating enzyme